jgi:ArsR family transcriptional regulator
MMTQLTKSRPATPKQAARCCAPIDGLLDAELFKALGDPTRLSLLACLAKCGRPCSVGEIAACCAVDLSVVSRHLALLERAGALESTKEGRTVFYTVRFTELSKQLRALAKAIEGCGPRGSACCG